MSPNHGNRIPRLVVEELTKSDTRTRGGRFCLTNLPLFAYGKGHDRRGVAGKIVLPAWLNR